MHGVSVKTLKRMLKKAGLKTTGRKAALTRRAKKAHLKIRGGVEPGFSNETPAPPSLDRSFAPEGYGKGDLVEGEGCDAVDPKDSKKTVPGRVENGDCIPLATKGGRSRRSRKH